jgi:DegV family protein with EDD domain
MIRIITDSTSDISRQKKLELDIDIIPLRVNFGTEVYRDGIDITNKKFYEKLSAEKQLPTTSQINPYEFSTIFQEYIDAEDEIIGIFISSHLSGTYQSAVLAKEMISSQNIYLIDSQNVTFALALLVEEAVKLRSEGLTAIKITNKINELKNHMRLIAVVNTLKYLKLGGRISAGTAMLGNMLGINPIITVKDGEVQAIGKARGRKMAFRFMLNTMQKDHVNNDYPIYFGHTNSPAALKELMDFFIPHLDNFNIYTSEIGSVVGTYAGPGAVGLAYIAKNKIL